MDGSKLDVAFPSLKFTARDTELACTAKKQMLACPEPNGDSGTRLQRSERTIKGLLMS